MVKVLKIDKRLSHYTILFQITGAKAPPLRYLGEWLEQNPMWDVDPKWSELVRAKVCIVISDMGSVVFLLHKTIENSMFKHQEFS